MPFGGEEQERPRNDIFSLEKVRELIFLRTLTRFGVQKFHFWRVVEYLQVELADSASLFLG